MKRGLGVAFFDDACGFSGGEGCVGDGACMYSRRVGGGRVRGI